MVRKLEGNEGVSVFAKERAKFEGWLKVELCETLSRYFPDVAPERKRIDITLNEWAIEVKTVNELLDKRIKHQRIRRYGSYSKIRTAIREEPTKLAQYLRGEKERYEPIGI